MEEGLTLGAMGAAFASGWISVLSPCVMPLMPAYLSLISGVSVETTDVVDPIIAAAIAGDYVLEEAHLRGKRPVEFVGRLDEHSVVGLQVLGTR